MNKKTDLAKQALDALSRDELKTLIKKWEPEEIHFPLNDLKMNLINEKAGIEYKIEEVE